MNTLHINLGERGYDIQIGHGLLGCANEFWNLKRKVFIVTDTGVPSEYAKTLATLADEAKIVTVPEGEGSKSLETFSHLMGEMISFGLTRTDCAVAVGGGVVGDLTGFLAASYMRGIDFYNAPTTLLSQVDSSIGGKTALNAGGVKNIVGAFYQPKGVIVDLDTLKTLPQRQLSNGLAEAVKMSLTSDAELFSLFEKTTLEELDLLTVVTRSLMIKKRVVEEDERETGLRKILNFGHTLGHAVEAKEEMHGIYHGECVAIGMTAVCAPRVRERLLPVLRALSLPTVYEGDLDAALSYIKHDKKCEGRKISVVLCNEVGSFVIEKMSTDEFASLVKTALT